MQFHQVLQSLKPDGEDWLATVPEDWLQGRSCFGGLQAALALRAMRTLVPELPLRSLQTSFIAPIAAGSLRLRVRILRSGKSVSHVEAQLLDGEQIACLVVGIFGLSRPSSVVITPPAIAIERSAEDALELPYMPGITPAFIQHLQMRWARGSFPFMGHKEPRSQIHIRLRDDLPVDEAKMIAYADAIPSPALSLFKKPTMASSMTWTLDVLTDRIEGDAAGYWRMDAEVSAGRDGYSSQTAMLWNQRSEPVALSRQSVVIFG